MAEENQYQSLQEYVADLYRKKQQTPEDGLVRYNLACVLIGQGKYEEAEEELKLAIQYSPDLAEAYVQLGGLAMRKGDLATCLSFNRKAAEIRPRFAVPHGNIGFVYLQQGEVDKAIGALKKALSLDPKFLQARSTLGSAHLMEGDVEGCIDECTKVVEQEPTFGPAYNNLCLAYMEKGDFQQAIRYCDLAREYGFQVAQEVIDELQPHRAG